jgi:Fe-S-cluster containining protein
MPDTRYDAALANYRQLVSRIDELATRIVDRFGDQISCRSGCSGCCRHLTLFPVEAAALLAAVAKLPAPDQNLFPPGDGTGSDSPCPLLHDDRCLAYAARPIICRTHGLPLLTTAEGERRIDYCPENFRDATSLPGDGIIDLETLNRTLVAVNARFLQDTAASVFAARERFSIAEIVGMARAITTHEGEKR